jgi:cysteine desulfuration protein SufE
MSDLPPRLADIIEDFSYCEGQEKLEYLLELSERLPPLPEWLEGRQNDMDRVHECMSPVFIYPEKKDNRVIFHFDIPPEAPTVRGVATALKEGLDGCTVAEVTAVSDTLYVQMGLDKVITGQRLNGLIAMLSHVKALANS